MWLKESVILWVGTSWPMGQKEPPPILECSMKKNKMFEDHAWTAAWTSGMGTGWPAFESRRGTHGLRGPGSSAGFPDPPSSVSGPWDTCLWSRQDWICCVYMPRSCWGFTPVPPLRALLSCVGNHLFFHSYLEATTFSGCYTISDPIHMPIWRLLREANNYENKLFFLISASLKIFLLFTLLDRPVGVKKSFSN